MTRQSLGAIACLGTLAATVSCTYVGGQFQTPPMTESKAAMKGADLGAALLLEEPSWVPIPIGEYTDSRIVRADIVDGMLYAVDGNRTAHAIDLAKGEHRWVLDLPEMPTDAVSVGPSHVAFLSERRITVATRDSGTLITSRDLGFSPSSGPAISADTLYCGSWGDGYRMRTVSLFDGWKGWAYTAEGPITSRPLVIGSGAARSLYFASHDGSVASVDPRPAAAKGPADATWVSHTLGPNSADLAYDDDSIFVASEDRALYSLSRSGGVVQWKWLESSAPLVDAPIVSGPNVYQPSGGDVVAIERASGGEVYRVAGAERFLTRVGARDYFKLAGSGVVAVDGQTGEVLAEVRSPLFDQLPSNPNGGALVFSDGKTLYAFE